MVFDINGKIALITGGAQGIGYEFAKELFRNGLEGVTIADIDTRVGEEAIKELNNTFGEGKAIFVKTDVTDIKNFEEAFKRTVETFEHVDILINNAGILNDGPDMWEKSIKINVNGVIHGMILGMDKYLKNFKITDEAVIANMCSVASTFGIPCIPVYTATKFAGAGIVKSWGTPDHFKRSGVRVIGLCPGATDTALMDLKGQGKTLGPDYDDILNQQPVPLQGREFVGREMIKLIKNAPNGSLWIAENEEPVYEYIVPSRSIYKP